MVTAGLGCLASGQGNEIAFLKHFVLGKKPLTLSGFFMMIRWSAPSRTNLNQEIPTQASFVFKNLRLALHLGHVRLRIVTEIPVIPAEVGLNWDELVPIEWFFRTSNGSRMLNRNRVRLSEGS